MLGPNRLHTHDRLPVLLQTIWLLDKTAVQLRYMINVLVLINFKNDEVFI